MQNGISAGYDEWTHHGESCDVSDDRDDDDVSFNDEEAGNDNMNGGNDDDNADDDLDEMLDNIGQGTWGDKWKTSAESSSSIGKDLESLQVSNDMRWHKDVRVNDDNVATHPADSEALKHFKREFSLFAHYPRNVCLGLATDGFNPFGNLSSSYSIWPIFIVPYNLPPWKCMKDPYIFMSMLILGPKTPTNIDVYLQPLIGELNDLWGGKTKDTWKSRKDLMDEGLKKSLHLVEDGNSFIMPKACYHFTKDEKQKVERNNEMVDIDGDISFFSCKEHLLGNKITRDISNNELEKIHTYILHNCDEMVELINEHKLKLEKENCNNINELRDKHFASWLQERVNNCPESFESEIRLLSRGPLSVNEYSRCMVNGVSDVRGLQVDKESTAQSSQRRGSNPLELVDGITFSSDSTGKASKTRLLIDEENINDEETDPSDLESSEKEGSLQEDESSQEDYTNSD
ncbi:leucine-rich repeat protein [Tanacetum coccineum]